VSPPIAKDLAGFERVVDATAELKIRFIRKPAQCKRDDVMELQTTGLCTAALCADEAAPPLVSGPDGSTNVRRHMPTCFTSAIAAAVRRRPRASNRANFRALGLLQQHGQGSVHDRGRIPIWNYMSQQIARPLQLLVRPFANGHPNQIPPWGERRDDRGRARGR
jgi:hypothetical protein